jgi:DNA-binding IclR family transcriptional regulator
MLTRPGTCSRTTPWPDRLQEVTSPTGPGTLRVGVFFLHGPMVATGAFGATFPHDRRRNLPRPLLSQVGLFKILTTVHILPESGAGPIEDVAEQKTAYDVPPVTRAFNLLRYIAAGNRCRNMSRAAADLSINRTTLIRLLHTLQREQMIELDPKGTGYSLSYGVLELASNLLSSRDIVRVSRPVLSHLAAQTGLSAHLGVLSGTDVIVLVRETPDVQLVSNIREGSRLPAHATVMGRMILANMPRAEVEALLKDYNFSAITEKTATTMESLGRQLDADLASGLAWSVAFFEQGIGSCAGVVRDHEGTPIAAISVSGQQAVFDEDAPERGLIADAVRLAAERLSSIMGHIAV